MTRELNKALQSLTTQFRPPASPLITGAPSAATTRYALITDPSYAAEWSVIDAIEAEVGVQWLTGPEIQRYVDIVLAMPWPGWTAGDWSVVVQINDFTPTAVYRSGVITVPHSVRAIVILHELGHHLALAVPRGATSDYHGPVWINAYLTLIGAVMNPATAELFRLSFEEAGLI